LQVGSIQKNITTDTVADGLRGTLGERNFSIINSFSPTIIGVGEADILAAQKELQVALQVPVETSSAVAYAATVKGKLHGQIGVILTGGNV